MTIQSDTSKTAAGHAGQRSYSRVYPLILCALFTALTGVSSFLSIPLPFTPVPVNLATLAVMLSGLLLGAKYGSLSQLVYLLSGAIGVPVFSGGSSGLGILTGATGGYLIGYLFCAACCGAIAGNSRNPLRTVPAMIVGIAVCYTLGTLWYIHLTGIAIVPAFLSCVLPFIPGDLLKITAAAVLVHRFPRGSMIRTAV